MKKIFKILVFVIVLLFFYSCGSSSFLIKAEDRIEITKRNIINIEGVYKNSSDSLNNNINLWKELKPFPQVKEFQQLSIKSNTIKIELLEKNKILFSLFIGDTLYDTKEIKYQLKNGVVMIKSINNMRIWGIPLIVFQHIRENINLGLDENDNLIVAFEGRASGGVFIFIFGTEIYGYNILEKINDK